MSAHPVHNPPHTANYWFVVRVLPSPQKCPKAFMQILPANILINFHKLFPVKPFLIRGPQNQTAVVGSSVTFQCRVGGEPLPDVLWRRTASGGNMPLGE